MILIENLLFIEKNLQIARTLEVKIDLIYKYDPVRFGDIREIVNNLPEMYAEILIDGTISTILSEIKLLKKKYKNEVRAIENKSLNRFIITAGENHQINNLVENPARILKL